MRTSQTFSISFITRKKKKQPDLALLYARITVNGKSLEISLKRTIPVDKWNQAASKLSGSSSESRQINKKIDETKAQLYKTYDGLLKEGLLVTTQTVKARFLGSDQQHYTLAYLINYHKEKMGKVLKYGTMKNYTTTENYLKGYLKAQYHTSDVYLKQIDYQFILGFESYLRTLPSLQNNGVMKHMERFKKLMRLAEHLDWIEKNPTKRFKLRFDQVDMVYLNKPELEKIKNEIFEKPVLTINRDIFVFACYTGLAYADAKALNNNHLQIGIDGNKWIYTRRSKTNTAVRIPILKEAQKILDQYRNHPKIDGTENLLPVYSNQKTNQYLKEIAKVLKINKKLSFHTARHTFATTVTLANGVPIETVSKLLGHTKLSTTQIYARVIDSKISSDIDVLREKLNLLQAKENSID
ncbi:Site-specific recombinase XerD [Salegentibacter echinorum]|uniref:Site-specific recombinase XerD n=1 Tax=Salegentibacter echinorum TaxID=1073325 RepID=A0A1M5CL56_SALEC|nr:site-specific integrase [Salegentibacter echinorum]SHF55494.1 Site-specific recombinase XerD [Salegentibacter echinorum]